jgi:hypothetical protein
MVTFWKEVGCIGKVKRRMKKQEVVAMKGQDMMIMSHSWPSPPIVGERQLTRTE